MILLLMRHATAEDFSPDGSDASRRLTARGEEESDAVGAMLARAGVSIDGILTSPLVRARQTAERVARARSDSVQVEVWRRLAESPSRGDLQRLSRERAAASTLMLVGHEPDMSRLVRELTGARARMKKGAVAAIEFDPDSAAGELLWFWRASHARRLVEADPDA